MRVTPAYMKYLFHTMGQQIHAAAPQLSEEHIIQVLFDEQSDYFLAVYARRFLHNGPISRKVAEREVRKSWWESSQEPTPAEKTCNLNHSQRSSKVRPGTISRSPSRARINKRAFIG